MKEIEIPDNLLKIIQECISLRPVIVLGSGASCQYGIAGMPELAAHLISAINPIAEDQDRWFEFKSKIQSGVDLETSLHEVMPSNTLEKQIIEIARDLVLEKDTLVFKKSMIKSIKFPLSDLLQHLVHTANPEIEIITTNYDRIAEYAIDHACLSFNNGFYGRYYQSYEGFDNSCRRSKPYLITLLKVHGSIDWFVDGKTNIISLPDDCRSNDDLIPLMVTPGVRKYEHTHSEPFRSIISKADDAFKNANSIICIGYGFNDIHIHPKLVERIRRSKIPILILAKKLSQNAVKFVRNASFDKVLGIEEDNSGAKIVQSKNNDEIYIKSDIWQLETLLNMVI